MLVDTTARDTSIELFGRKLSAPICFSPVGINKVGAGDILRKAGGEGSYTGIADVQIYHPVSA